MQIEKIKVDEIIPYADNAKLHPERQIEKIRSSILEFGFNDPIAIDENNVVIEGNGRLMAIKDLGFKEVDCIRIEGLIRPMESTCGEYYQDAHARNERIAILSYLHDLHELDSRVCINYKWHEVNTQFDKCYANFSQIAINENSEVMYCCHKPYEIIGKLTDSDIWEKQEKFQTNMQMCDVPCRLTAPNNFIQSLQDAPSDAAFI